MSKDAASLPSDVETLQRLVVELSTTVTTQQRQLDQLQHYIAQLLKARFGPRSERVDPQQLALFAKPNVAPPPPAPPVATTVAAHVRRGGGRNASKSHYINHHQS